MDFDQIVTTITTLGIAFGLKVAGAIVVWIVGRYLIGLAVRLVSNALEKQRVDPTVLRYLGTVISVILNIILVIAILGYFGVETTTFAALFAAAGVAIGLAWSGLLANFAAGAFMIVLRPIKVGDFVTAGGVTGTVKEIGLFVTVITTPDNVQTILGNNKIFSDSIQNFSVNPYRRVDLKAQLNHSVDCNKAVQLLKERVAKVPNVKTDPAPDVEIFEFNLAGPVLACVPIVIPIITGRFILIPIGLFANHSVLRDFRFQSNTWPSAVKRRGTGRVREQKKQKARDYGGLQ